jgi:hypothetical protein
MRAQTHTTGWRLTLSLADPAHKRAHTSARTERHPSTLSPQSRHNS